MGHFHEIEDEYIETLYEFYEANPGERVRTGVLAARLNISPASVTEMLQRMASKGHVEYMPYRGVELTEEGLAYGRKMKRRHRLAEVLLGVLPFEGDIHETACLLEHAINDDLETALSVFLGNPVADSNGNEIPRAQPEVAERVESALWTMSPLTSLVEGEGGKLACYMLCESTISNLEEEGLNYGCKIVKQNGRYILEDDSVLAITPDLAAKVFVHKDGN